MTEIIRCPNCGKEITEVIHQPGFCPHCGYGYSTSSFESESIQRRILATYSDDEYSKGLATAGPKDRPKDWFMKREYITASLADNRLVSFLYSKFENSIVNQVAARYRLETHGKDDFKGAAVFYQFDSDNVCRAFKVIQYDESGHRITGEKRNPKSEKDLLYQKSLIGPGEYCLFGRHLLNDPKSNAKPICIVESEKSAIIASIAYPQAIWMAAGSCYYLYGNKIDRKMANHEIILFPDVDVKYEPIDIDETTGIRRCINWYVIKDRPHGIGLPKMNANVNVSGFLDSYIKTKCEKCIHKEYCSNSIWYNTGLQQAPYIIENRARKFDLQAGDETLLNTTGEKKTIPKIVLEAKDNKKKMKECLYRGWDIGDYIIHSKKQGEPLVPFNKLIEKIDEVSLGSIIQKILCIEESIQLSSWITAIEKNNNNICQPPSPQ